MGEQQWTIEKQSESPQPGLHRELIFGPDTEPISVVPASERDAEREKVKRMHPSLGPADLDYIALLETENASLREQVREAEAQFQRLREAGDGIAMQLEFHLNAEYRRFVGMGMSEAAIDQAQETDRLYLATYRSTTEGEGDG